ncbi:hypothetical protein BGX29_000477 [Mortierella sp. GBA35]|nr:hypothetical protein BGX29_000477 [Mortierella sp. GBA35]
MAPTPDSFRVFRVKKFVLKGAYEFHARLEAFLDVLPKLTVLVLDGLIKGPLRIDILLGSCPSLQTLSIEYALSDHVLWGPPRFINDEQRQQLECSVAAHIERPLDPPPPSGHGLQKLVLRHVTSSQAVLQTMLQALPSLSSLEVRFLQIPNSHLSNPGIFDRFVFYQSLSGSCPKLQSLHLSFFRRQLTVEDAVTMCEALPTLTGLSFPCQDLESYRRSSAHQQAVGAIMGSTLPTTGILEFYVNHLTSLELIAYRYSQEDSLISNLHAFLTEATHLRHLVAPRVFYWTEFLEMLEIKDNTFTTTNSRLASTAGGENWASSRTKTWGWACRRLETLHLGFKPKDGTNYGYSAGTAAEKSRVMFGFIARFCPELKDLRIRKIALDMSLEGGFCLLTQLKQLERLTVWSQTRLLSLAESDLDWIGYSAVEDPAVADDQKDAPMIEAATTVTPPLTKTTPSTTTKAAISTSTAIAIATGTVSTTTAPITVTVDTIPANSTSTANGTSTANDTSTAKKGTKKFIKSFFRRLSSSSSSSPSAISSSTTSSNTRPPTIQKPEINPPAAAQAQAPGTLLLLPAVDHTLHASQIHVPVPVQKAETLAEQHTDSYNHMPPRVHAVFKKDEEWYSKRLLLPSSSKWKFVIAHKNRPCLRSTTEQAARIQEAPFASKEISTYRCWPHLRSMVWAVDPQDLDIATTKLITTLRPDINFKVQQYIAQW